MIDFAFKYGDLTTREIADSFDKEYKTNEKWVVALLTANKFAYENN
jgi:hypothetical protein